jgi:hypothetical protein
MDRLSSCLLLVAEGGMQNLWQKWAFSVAVNGKYKLAVMVIKPDI